MKNKYVPLDEITALTARCEAAEKERDALRAKLEIVDRKAETLQRALDGSRAEVFRLADKLRVIDPGFQSPMMLNKIGEP